ncbi:hypothetical protein [Ruegeria arenilitoris]|uniref:hypothetical protein n=1 Tax=Ruegeria arenilitoris TaxID=1173585 RepID=UPI001C94D1B1|nr:hypothetical protein [Ruegeria arenilitoris]MBY6082077.1 hypothetical protein [Ruegeria arenilitoris]
METLAYDYLYLDPNMQSLLGLLAIFSGAIFGGLVLHAPKPLRRSPAFLLVALVGLVTALAGFAWTNIEVMANNNSLWLLAANELGIKFAGGVCFVLIAKGRAIDAYGSAWYAFLGFVPLINLFLIFKPSLNRLPKEQTGLGALAGVPAVVLGLFLLGGIGAVERAVARSVAQQFDTPRTEEALRVGYLRSLDTEVLLDLLVSQFDGTLPKLYSDGTTTLMKVEGKEGTFTYHYQLDTSYNGPLWDEAIAHTTEGNCDPSGAVRPIIDLGVKIQHTYENRNDQPLGSFIVSLKDCEKT